MWIFGSLVCLFITSCVVTSGSRILMLPSSHKAHVNFHGVLGAELKSRGHHVDVVVSTSSEQIAKDHGLNTIPVSFERNVDYTLFEKYTTSSRLELPGFIKAISDIEKSHILTILSDNALIAKLKANNYDLAILEGVEPFRGLFILPYKLGIKTVTLQFRPDPWNLKVPALPSVEGFHPLLIFDKNTVFYERVLNTIMYLLTYNFMTPPCYALNIYDDLLDEFAPEKPNVGLLQLYRDTELTLILMDTYCTDQHRISAPHMQYVGGLGAHPAEPLPNDLEKFMDSATEGAIVFTLGSGLRRLPQAMMDKMLAVFKDIKQKVVIRHDGDLPKDIPKNVLIQKWLPQNDLLGHRNTKVFITHSGNNGQLEGVYHGVPMLMLPHLGDQFHNTKRAEKRNYGLQLNAHQFTIEELNGTLHELLFNPLYRDSIQKCSAILHSIPPPPDTAAFWIEHVLTFGGDHLKPYYIDMPLWKLFLVDVFAFLLIVNIIVIYLMYRCVKCCCCRKKSRKPKKE